MQPDAHSDLPAVDEASASHSRHVAAFIHRQIEAAGGRISFAEYMQHALYAPGLGYYAAGATKFGAAGDFITAPEVSPLFGRMVARQCADLLAESDASRILEIGAGSGKLVVDILTKLAELDALPDSYDIFEVSADLQQRQRTLIEAELPDLAGRVRWLDGWPAEFRGIIIANEVLDALPVERFMIGSDGVEQLCVESAGGGFSLSWRTAPDGLAQVVMAIEKDLGQPLPEGYISDVCLAAPQWIGELASTLDEGLALLFDYGVSRREYYAEARAGGWLRCHFRHQAHNDALRLPGIQDITAWVDFSAVAETAAECGLDVAGFVTQAQFMINGGLEEELSGMAEMPIDAQLKLASDVKLLTLPGEMGEHFKCIGLTRGGIPVPRALRVRDRAAAL